MRLFGFFDLRLFGFFRLLVNYFFLSLLFDLLVLLNGLFFDRLLFFDFFLLGRFGLFAFFNGSGFFLLVDLLFFGFWRDFLLLLNGFLRFYDFLFKLFVKDLLGLLVLFLCLLFDFFLLLLQKFIYMLLFGNFLVAFFDFGFSLVGFLLGNLFGLFFLSVDDFVDAFLLVLFRSRLFFHFLLDKSFDGRLLVFVDIDSLCGVARNNFFNQSVELLKGRRIGCVITFDLEIDLCVEVLLHSLESFETSLILLASKNHEHEINHADKHESGKVYDAHFRVLQSAVTPKGKQAEQYKGYCEEHARTHVFVLFDKLVVDGAVADYIAGISETHSEILHPCVAKLLRRLFRETMRREIADVVVVNGIDVGKVFSDFFA